MRVLFTGDAGVVGRPCVAALRAEGIEVIGFDAVRGQDINDVDALGETIRGCGAVVHAAALAHDRAGSPEQIDVTNVRGTANVLAAARAAGVERFVYFSSMQVLGIAEGERPPAYLPLDDAHPRLATRPYGRSKCAAEDLCATATKEWGVASIALRPVAVWTEKHYRQVTENREADPTSEWTPFWEGGLFIDARDVASAVVLSLRAPVSGHVRVSLCAPDISASAPTLEMVDRFIPDVPWVDGARDQYESDPWRALVDTSAARDALGWTATHTWQEWVSRSKSSPDGRLESAARRIGRHLRRP